MYYEMHGAGKPMLLLHGGSATIEESFSDQLEQFAEHHLLIAPEQQGHGHTKDIDAPLDYVVMAENTAQLLKRLRLKDVDVVGWSDGGILGLLLAARHPQLVHRLVVTGATFLPLPQAAPPKVVKEIATWDPEDDPEGAANYAKRFADPVSHYPIFIEKIKDLWFHHPTEAELGPPVLASIHAPTLVIDGDHDSARLEHTISLYRNLPKAHLLIVPGTGHDTLGTRPQWLNPIILAFLNGKAAAD